ncbi:MAG: hypothetical protein AAGE59_27240 [Cyanobacteria bacterium P01_F01_bin.86]
MPQDVAFTLNLVQAGGDWRMAQLLTELEKILVIVPAAEKTPMPPTIARPSVEILRITAAR